MELWTINKKTDPLSWHKEPFNPFQYDDVPGAVLPVSIWEVPLLDIVRREVLRDVKDIRWIVFNEEEEAMLNHVGKPLFGENCAVTVIRSVLSELRRSLRGGFSLTSGAKNNPGSMDIGEHYLRAIQVGGGE